MKCGKLNKGNTKACKNFLSLVYFSVRKINSPNPTKIPFFPWKIFAGNLIETPLFTCNLSPKYGEKFIGQEIV